jgi:uncharacterized membrane protein
MAVVGVVWFIALAAIQGIQLRRQSSSLAWMRFGLAASDLTFVFYLIYLELFVINAVCVWCTIIHAIVVILFLSSVYQVAGLRTAAVDRLSPGVPRPNARVKPRQASLR